MPTLSFHALRATDLALLHAWHGEPHVAAWWTPVPTLEELREEYFDALQPPGMAPLDVRGGVARYLGYEGDEPVAYFQAYRVMAAQAEGWWPDERDPHALGTDQFIGPPSRLDRGLGTRLVGAFLDFLFADPRVTKVQVDPAPDNLRAIACYRKAGFHEVGPVSTPDGPALLLVATRETRAATLPR